MGMHYICVIVNYHIMSLSLSLSICFCSMQTRVIYSEDFPSSTYQLNCTTDSEIASVCAQLDTITFTERTGTQFSDYLKGVWIEDRNIDTELIS